MAKNKATTELLDLEETIVSTTTFKLKKIEMKDDLEWRIKLELNTKLSQTFREYDVRFSVNETPFKLRIEGLERKIESIESDRQDSLPMGVGTKKDHIKQIHNEIKDIEQELKDMENDCPPIDFKGTIEELKYKDGGTFISMLFPGSIVNELNEKKFLLVHYKIELIRK